MQGARAAWAGEVMRCHNKLKSKSIYVINLFLYNLHDILYCIGYMCEPENAL
jgi:hypothetical protein